MTLSRSIGVLPACLLATLLVSLARAADESAGDAAAEPAAVEGAAADAKYTLKYKFQQGEIIQYDVRHRASIRNTIDEHTENVRTATDSLKVWKILDVLENGEFELAHVVQWVRMRNEMPDRAAMEYDSRNGDAPPPGFEDAAQAVGVPLSVLRLSPAGEVLHREIKHHQPAADHDAPVTVRLPPGPVAIGDVWNETLPVKVNLKSGGTQMIETRRQFRLESVAHGVATIRATYQILSPVNAHIEAQLVQRLMDGTVRFDIEKGRVLSQEVEIDKRVLGYAGPTSSMHYVMQMTERLQEEVPDVARKE